MRAPVTKSAKPLVSRPLRVRGSFACSLNLDHFKGVPPEFNRVVKRYISAQA